MWSELEETLGEERSLRGAPDDAVSKMPMQFGKGDDLLGQAQADGSASVLRFDHNCANGLYTKNGVWRDTHPGPRAIWAVMWEDLSKPGYTHSFIDCAYPRDACTLCRFQTDKVDDFDGIDRCGPVMLQGGKVCPTGM